MELELWQLALLTAVGIVGGFLNVMAGGGSLLTVPVMVFMGLPGPVANGTNRIAILAELVMTDLERRLESGICIAPCARAPAADASAANRVPR